MIKAFFCHSFQLLFHGQARGNVFLTAFQKIAIWHDAGLMLLQFTTKVVSTENPSPGKIQIPRRGPMINAKNIR